MSADLFVQCLMSGLTQGSIYALIGLGFTIIYAVTQIINFAQGEFVMLGGMFSWYFAIREGLSMPLAILIAILVSAAIGALMYVLAIRTARRASVISLIIITIGAAIFIRGIAGNRFGVNDASPPPPAFTSTEESIQIGNLDAYVDPQALWIIGITFAVTIVLYLFLSHTMVGKALRACAVNLKAASLVGINTKSMALIAFIIAGVIGGIGGVVVAPLQDKYDMGIMLGLRGFVAASIGGFMSPVATVIGGLVLGIVENLAIGLDWGPFTSAYKDVIPLIVLLLILLIRSGKLAAAERAG